ncbi:tyrosine-type recombinase/integrase [Bacillus haynesii]|uniref:tyrosine-type recombinase/integrase n=1 Tax=Bacillus haynesii TaxID=1925021 RepID=UPI002280437C|nr:tyrosine-type recombinase/integrase [Bacillus haynesii]MCY9274533.1 tyrosine-type recombinase/integrase [Bacillus haynesii]
MARKFITERRPTATRSVPRTDAVPRPPERTYSIEEVLDIFILAKEAEGVRERTIADYRSHIGYLSEYLSENYPEVIDDIGALTPNIIREYVNYLRKERKPYKGAEYRNEIERKGLAVNTINMRLRTLKTMCRFWYAESITPINAMENIGQVRDDSQKEVEGFRDDALNKILDSLDDRQFAQWRDKVLMYLMLDTGLRPEEGTTVKISQFDFTRLIVVVPSYIAKNRRDREIPITREVAKMVKALYEESCQYFGPQEYVFINAYGQPFTSGAFRKRLNRMKKNLRLDKVFPNMFRHTFARNYILNGGDIFTLQIILDHADIKTTRKYVQMSNEDVKAQHNKHSPVRRYLRR